MTRLERYREKLARLEEKRALLMRSGRYLESNALNDDIKDVERAIREAEEYEERCKPRSLKDTVSKEELDEMGIIPLMIVCHLASDFLTGVCYDIVDRCKAHGFTDVRLMPELKEVLRVNNRFASALTEMGPSLSKIITGNETLNEAILKKYITYIEQRLTQKKEMIVFRYLAFTLLIALVINQRFIIRRLKKELRSANEGLDESDRLNRALNEKIAFQDKITNDCMCRAFKFLAAQSSPAEIEETEYPSMFEVVRKQDDAKVVCKTIYYDPSDPDDREYKRIHAEEVAEILNEKP